MAAPPIGSVENARLNFSSMRSVLAETGGAVGSAADRLRGERAVKLLFDAFSLG